MRIDAGRIHFSTPPGFKDTTSYSFVARGGGEERIEIDGGPLPYGVTDLDAMMGDKRAELTGALPVVVDGQAMITLDGIPARTLSFTLAAPRAVVRGRLAMALDPAQRDPLAYVQIAYTARADDEHEAERFAHVLSSASFTSESFTTPEGYVRRWAGRLWLDMPAYLEPPRTYVFLSPDETMRIEVALVDPNAEPSIDREIETDLAQGGTVRDRTSSAISTPRLSGTLHGYTITRVEGGVLLQDVVRRAHLFLRDVPVAHVSGRAPSVDAQALDAAVDALVQGIDEAGRP